MSNERLGVIYWDQDTHPDLLLSLNPFTHTQIPNENPQTLQ